MKKMLDIMLHADGACSGNPGPGGYCGILKYQDMEKTVCGYEKEATNNRMELKAVIEALKCVKRPCNITVSTDSQYLITCTRHNDDWLKDEKRPNHDLWMEYVKAKENGKHQITFIKVKGHAGEEMNERCDKEAKAQIKKAQHLMLF